MLIIVGLGNKGIEYQNTYHNIGFMVADKLAEKFDLKFGREKNKAISCEGIINDKKVIILKPTTYMNKSGEAVVLFKNKYKDSRVIVIVDDIDLPAGKIRYRKNGSAGTHNGLRSIVSYIGEDFERVKVGIGRDPSMDLADFVLSKIKDVDSFNKTIDEAVKMILDII